MNNIFEDKIITIFGGTGTIGSLIVNYLHDLNPKVIRVFSNDENSLWEAQQQWKNDGMRYLLGDIRNLERCRLALKGVDYVFNCAAIKHVPFAEYNPLEAVSVNINGLDNIINACVERKVKKLLHISTDKAVEPTTVMGNTKAIGERLLQMKWAQNPEVNMICIRSGNVWDSRGSIIKLIKECQKQEKPIPITDKDMVRYFIKPQELIDFIMKAFEYGKKGEIWIPKLREVRIMDIIRNGCPEDYPIVEIGRRKGEKIKEKLISETELNVKEYEKYWIIENDWVTMY